MTSQDLDCEPMQTEELTALLSAALDEIFRLRKALAYEARVTEAHYEGFKTFPKSRRKIAEEQVERMRLAVWSPWIAYHNKPYLTRELDHLYNGERDHLTVGSWAAELQAVIDGRQPSRTENVDTHTSKELDA